MNEKDYQCTPEERAALDALLQEARDAGQRAQGAMRTVAAIHALQGEWNYADGRFTRQER
jgi:hypothetical protein